MHVLALIVLGDFVVDETVGQLPCKITGNLLFRYTFDTGRGSDRSRKYNHACSFLQVQTWFWRALDLP